LNNIRIIICDTNKAELETYARICRTICEDKQIPTVLTTFSNSQTLLFEMSDTAFSSMVSILILEPDNGCESVASAVRSSGYNGIILYLSRSSDIKYFYQAFDVKAFNYVRKGDIIRFPKVFMNTIKAVEQLERQRISLSFAGEYKQIDMRDIYYFETTMDHMVCVWYNGGKFIFQSSLSNLEGRLKEYGFLRTHRSYLVSLNAISRITFDEVTLNDGKAIPISRGRYHVLKEAMDKWR